MEFLKSDAVQLVMFLSASITLIVFISVAIKNLSHFFNNLKNNMPNITKVQICKYSSIVLLMLSVVVFIGIVILNFYEVLFSWAFGSLSIGVFAFLFVDNNQTSDFNILENVSIMIIFVFSLIGIMKYLNFGFSTIQTKFGNNNNQILESSKKSKLTEYHMHILNFMVSHNDKINERQIEELANNNFEFKIAFSELKDDGYIVEPSVFISNQPYYLENSRLTEIYKLVKNFKIETNDK